MVVKDNILAKTNMAEYPRLRPKRRQERKRLKSVRSVGQASGLLRAFRPYTPAPPTMNTGRSCAMC